MSFDSVYEITTPLDEIKKQHFVEYFSGDSLNSRWTYIAGAGGVIVSAAMADEVDGGYKFVMTNGHIGSYDFNNVRQYNQNGAVIIGSHKRVNSAGIIGNGFKGDRASTEPYMDERNTRILIRNASLTIQCLTSNSTYGTYHDTTVVSDNNYHILKTELTSGGTHFSVDGVLKVSSSGSQHETDEKLQPMLMAWANGSGSGGYTNYMECYNT